MPVITNRTSRQASNHNFALSSSAVFLPWWFLQLNLIISSGICKNSLRYSLSRSKSWRLKTNTIGYLFFSSFFQLAGLLVSSSTSSSTNCLEMWRHACPKQWVGSTEHNTIIVHTLHHICIVLYNVYPSQQSNSWLFVTDYHTSHKRLSSHE